MFCQIGTKMDLTKVTQTLLQINLTNNNTILLEDIICQERLILLHLLLQSSKQHLNYLVFFTVAYEKILGVF